MSDALVNPAVAATMYACSSVAAGLSVRKLNKSQDKFQMANMGIMGAFVFAAQMINFSIPGTGSSGHIAGSVLLTAILGPYAAFLTMIGVLFIQCFLFADGGILALGCNIWNMGFYGVLSASVFFHLFLKKDQTSKKRIVLTSIMSSVVALQLGAFSVTIETLASGITDLPFFVFVSLMQPVHLAIGLVEGLITAAVLSFVYSARPDFLWFVKRQENMLPSSGKVKLLRIAFFVAFLLIGGVVSHFASSNPDGLEWSVAKTNENFGDETKRTALSFFDKIQKHTSLFPEYNIENDDTPAGTSISGVFGSLMVLLVFVLLGVFSKKIVKRVKDKV